MKRKNLLGGTMFCLMGMLLLTGCGKKETTQTLKELESNIKVVVEKVSMQKVSQLYEYTAIVEANAVNNIAPLTGGRIDKIYVEVGDRVSKGQVVAQMDENSLKQAKAQLDNLELTFSRIDELYKVGGVSKSDWDAQKTQLEVARTSYQNLKDNTQLISPISGMVTLRNYDSGDLYSGQPIIQVQQITPVKMNINVSEMQFTKVKKGMSAKIILDVYGNEEFSGKVSLVYPTVDSRSHTFPVEIMIPNANSKVRPGMYARVTLDFGEKDYVLVPDKAIVKQQGSGDRYVYVYKDGKVSYNKVILGRRIEDKYEVISGVQDADLVVMTGLFKLNDGMQVQLADDSAKTDE